MISAVSRQTISRLPVYLGYLRSLEGSMLTISATAIAEALSLNDVQVRKDLAAVSSSGKPKIGYVTADLISELENFLGYNSPSDALLAGAGKLGRALMSYQGFNAYGLNIVAAFDTDPNLINTQEAGKSILPLSQMKQFCEERRVRIGIITVPAACAQEVCEMMLESGILAIWNFAPVRLNVPDTILVQNENMASSLALLRSHLGERARL
ncbi:MAG: redox-sensing transcriptional repressor Rex [Christensenellaceae bacterium]|nr:redox-sensing transcriptional repressor Rex [Christensenellaceae bacterium]MBS6563857.1 redox-sensing transcriptional repressor Rex [Clostridiales bacterium]PWM01148.1 MAG: redox-sensing transcriptional repressor Rex [Selenomonadales bacterium]